jgi:hypothetical protein
MRAFRILAPMILALMFLAGTMALRVRAQELAPEVRLLSKIKEHLRDELSRLPNYTCLQTISRYRKPDARHDALAPLDQVRLEVVYNERKEWYGSPGDRSFTLENPVGFIGGGMIGTGAFGLQLHNIFISRAAVIAFHGAEQIEGRRVLQYDFHLSALQDAMVVSVLGGRGRVGEDGSFWIDEQTLDLLRVEARVVEIPPFLPLDSVQSKVSYARTRIGEHDVLLPQQAELYLAEPPGIENFNRSDFTHCRAFHVNSSISFGELANTLPVEAPKLLAAAEEGEAVPALLKVTVELTSPVTAKDAVGTLVAGRIVGDVLRKSKLVLANGAAVRGRIRRLERYDSRGYDTKGYDSKGAYIVGLEFVEVEAQGKALRFYADLLSIDPRAGIRVMLKELVPVPNALGRESTVTLPELPGVAQFFVTGDKLSVPAGLRTVWRTRGLLR